MHTQWHLTSETDNPIQRLEWCWATTTRWFQVILRSTRVHQRTSKATDVYPMKSIGKISGLWLLFSLCCMLKFQKTTMWYYVTVCPWHPKQLVKFGAKVLAEGCLQIPHGFKTYFAPSWLTTVHHHCWSRNDPPKMVNSFSKLLLQNSSIVTKLTILVLPWTSFRSHLSSWLCYALRWSGRGRSLGKEQFVKCCWTERTSCLQCWVVGGKVN